MESLYLVVPAGAGIRAQRGTAWLLWPDIVVTALHVAGAPSGAGQWAHDGLPGAANVYRLRLPSGRSVAVEPWIYDPRADVALLRLPEAARAEVPDGAYAVLAPVAPLAGDPWSAAGYPAFESASRALAVGGVVSRVGLGLSNDAMQLFVDQGTSATWGGISGSAAQNAFGEVIGVVLQTVAGIATCNAAPAEAVARLVRLLPESAHIAAQLTARIEQLGKDGAEEIANALEWAWLPGTPAFTAAPAAALAARISQAGEAGLARSLDAIRAIEARAWARAGQPVAPPEQENSLEARVRDLVTNRPDERDLLAVLDALADAGGAIQPASELRSSLPDAPAHVFPAALDRLHDHGLLAPGPRGEAAPIALSAEGARRAIRIDYARAALRVLVDGAPRSAADIQAGAGVPPRALHRTLAHALAMGLVEPLGDAHLITGAGRELLAKRTVLSATPAS